MTKINWKANHSFLMGALGASLKYTKNLDNSLEYFKELEKYFEDEEISKALFDIEIKRMMEKEICLGCGDGDPEKVGHRHMADGGFTCEICGNTYV